MRVRHSWGRTAAGLTVLLGLVVGAASPAVAVQTCAQLEQKEARIMSLLQHVRDPEARQRLFDQLEAVQAQLESQGCNDGSGRTVAGTATTWSDNSAAPGPSDTAVSFQVRLRPSGGVDWSLPTVMLSKDAWVTAGSGADPSGSWASTGYLSLNTPIKVHTGYGDGTGTLRLSTDSTVQTRSGTVTGSRVASPATQTGAVTLIGETSFGIAGQTIRAQVRIVATLS